MIGAGYGPLPLASKRAEAPGLGARPFGDGREGALTRPAVPAAHRSRMRVEKRSVMGATR